ncbi:MAG: hypothetical protein L6R42_002889 [Xanthoria sp. 1 TBL-2021]|nr:MAG: hypothetical protein L6R42_002889 [Xanthoria sp. 1 TBL-2021]
MQDGPGPVSEGGGARFGIREPFFDFDQMNYIVGLKRAFSDISFQDLTASFNYRYRNTVTVRELTFWFNDMERASQGEDRFNQRPELTEPFHFWPVDGFRKNDMDKLFFLATFRQAYEISWKLMKKPLTLDIDDTTGAPRPTSSNLRASKPDFIPYTDLSGSSSKTLREIYDDRVKGQMSS